MATVRVQCMCSMVYCISRASVSFSLSPEIAKLRDELAKVAVLSLVDGFMNESSILEIVPSIIDRPLAGPITPLNECNFLVPLASREEVKQDWKLETFRAATKDGPCSLCLVPWTS